MVAITKGDIDEVLQCISGDVSARAQADALGGRYLQLNEDGRPRTAATLRAVIVWSRQHSNVHHGIMAQIRGTDPVMANGSDSLVVHGGRQARLVPAAGFGLRPLRAAGARGGRGGCRGEAWPRARPRAR